MLRVLAARPLALAGPAAVAGVLLAGAPWPARGAAALLVAGWLLVRRTGPAAVAAAALWAGHAAGDRLARTTEANLEAAAEGFPWPRAPPRAALARLEVLRTGEDPFHARAWLEGRDARGVGVLCAWSGGLPAGVAPGARVEVAGRFAAPRGATNPGEHDRRRSLAERGVALRAELRTPENLRVLRPAPPGPRRWLEAARRAAAVRLRETLPPDVAPVAAAFLLGIRSGIEEEDRQLFERTGTLHLLAISGLHVVLLAGLVHALLRAAGVGPRAAAAITLGLALAYVPVAGAGAPIRRAVAMLAFYALALVRGRAPDAASALGGAALLLALLDPAEISRVGFRLSFAAAAGIAWLAGPWRARWSRRHRLLRRFPAVRRDRPVRLFLERYVLAGLPVALAAWCATQALVARAFGIVTPLAPLANLLAAPLVALLLPLVALVALGLRFLAGPAALVLRALRGTLALADRLPGGHLLLVPPPLPAVGLWLAGVALLRRRPRLGLAALAVACVPLRTAAPPPEPALVLLDVGHGQALLLRDGAGGEVLVDAGSRSRPDVARTVLLPALRALGVTRLDALVCTHADADHWNGAPGLLGLLRVGRVVTGPRPPPALAAAARRYDVPLVRAGPGDRLEGGAGRLLVVLGDGSSNDRSLALVWEVAGRRVLLPADREEAGLAELRAAGPGACDVLVAPHHGGRCAEALAFGRAVTPDLLLLSVGRGFADEATLAAYGARAVYRTDRDGCVIVRFPRGAAARVETFVPGPRATIRRP